MQRMMRSITCAASDASIRKPNINHHKRNAQELQRIIMRCTKRRSCEALMLRIISSEAAKDAQHQYAANLRKEDSHLPLCVSVLLTESQALSLRFSAQHWIAS
jgi:hypothetical protein